eukprot:2111309-Pyramimonas_sp.AAC.1
MGRGESNSPVVHGLMNGSMSVKYGERGVELASGTRGTRSYEGLNVRKTFGENLNFPVAHGLMKRLTGTRSREGLGVWLGSAVGSQLIAFGEVSDPNVAASFVRFPSAALHSVMLNAFGRPPSVCHAADCQSLEVRTSCPSHGEIVPFDGELVPSDGEAISSDVPSDYEFRRCESGWRRWPSPLM